VLLCLSLDELIVAVVAVPILVLYTSASMDVVQT